MHKLIFSLLALLLTFNGFPQSYWCIRNEAGEELLLTIHINQGNLTYEGHTRKEALKEMAGTFTYMLAKTAGKLRYPEIVHSEGKVSFNADTTYFTGNFDYLDKSFPLKAKIWNSTFIGILTDSRNRTHTLTGERVNSDQPLHDYSTMIDSSFSLTEKYYWDRNMIKSSDWLNFKNKVNEFKRKITDDYELGAILFWFSKKLPIAPYEIKKVSGRENEAKNRRVFAVREIRPKIAFLDLSNLPDDKENMDHLFGDIRKKECRVLILDARGRKNLPLTTATLLANHLTNLPADWGAFLTRKWTDNNLIVPRSAEYAGKIKNASQFTDKNHSIYSEKGCFLKLDPATIVFDGKIFMLIDQKTSRISEALAVWLKNDRLATIAGQKSAGQPMLFEAISVENQYQIILPTAQFYDKSGNSHAGSGVIPDLITEEDALNTILRDVKM